MHNEITSIMNNAKYSNEQKINALNTLHTEYEAKMRAASEGGMTGDENTGEALKAIDKALADLGHDPEDEHKDATL